MAKNFSSSKINEEKKIVLLSSDFVHMFLINSCSVFAILLLSVNSMSIYFKLNHLTLFFFGELIIFFLRGGELII